MSFDDLLAPLSHVPLLAGLQMAQLTELARRGEKLKYSPGDTLMKAGQPCDGAYLIIAGVVDRFADAEAAQAERIAPGTLLAEMAMLVEHTCAATHVARDRVYCLKLTRAAMHAQMLEDPALIEHFQRRITESVRRLAEQLRQMDSGLGGAAEASGAKSAQPPHSPLSTQTPTSAPAARFVAAPRAWR
jgi:CRP-like cAMP-binding protein